VSRPVAREVTSYREFTGYLDAVETVQVRARVRGFLRKIHFAEGAEVAEGALLYEIDPREYQAALDRARADLDRAEAELRRAAGEEKRAAGLRPRGAVSEEEYLQLQAGLKTARAAVDQAKAAVTSAELDLSFTRIYAPIGGRISRTLVTEGNLVGFNEPTLLTTIVRTDPLYVYFDVPERYLLEYERRARESPGAKIPIDVGVTAEEGYPHPGVIDFRENRVDPGTGTGQLRGRLENPGGALVPGLYARVRIPDGPPQTRLMVPEAAVLADQRGRYVFVVKPDNTAEYRPVTLGPRAGTLVAVVEGLEPDDRVVVNGLQRVRPGAPVTPELAAQSTERGAEDGKTS
ncbi:MAG TPA: efflux RND transporter periplasmic adaptor subunit, partial [Gemmataceae bacterium]